MVKIEDFGIYEGRAVKKYTVSRDGAEFSVIDYGATLTSITVPDANGTPTDVLLGYDTLEEYLINDGYLGASIGRVANRIAGASFEYFGTRYELYANDGPNTLHGGRYGFDKKMWYARTTENSVVMTYFSEDGEEGFFGSLDVEVEFCLEESHSLRITYTAVTDSESAVNLTNHAYFNLNGEGSGNVLNHRLTLLSSCITPINKQLITNGRFMPVSGTPFDFTSPKQIGEDLNEPSEQLINGGGYDHNFVLDGKDMESGHFATVVGDKSGIVMRVYTNQNGVQLYNGNFLSARRGKGGKFYDRREAFCLETQSFPNALNNPSYGCPVIRVGEVYCNETTFKFSVITEDK